MLVTGAAGGVGQFATQLARLHRADVVGVASPESFDVARDLGAHEPCDAGNGSLEAAGVVDLVFDTVGGDVLRRAPALLRDGGQLVSVAEEPPATGRIDTSYFVVEPNVEQLTELARLADDGVLQVAIDSVFPLSEAHAAFERILARGKRGKVVLRVYDAAS